MTVNVFTIVWNEELMLPKFLEHYSKYATNIFVIDDHSTDLTAEIAKAHPMVTYIPYEHDGWNEKEVSATFEKYARYFYGDWAICVDCDEFITGLEALEYETTGVLRPNGYMMVGKTGNFEDCKKIRMKQFDKPVIFTPGIDIHFGDGRHTCNLPARKTKMELLHYKYPSKEYYLTRNQATYARIMDENTATYRINRGLDWYERHV